MGLTMDKIAAYLELLQGMPYNEVVALLVYVAQHSKDFKELLSVTHLASNRLLLSRTSNAQIRPMSGSFISRLHRFIQKERVGFSSYEYFVLFTVIRSPLITRKVRDSLLQILDYEVKVIGNTRDTIKSGTCAICTYPTSSLLCKSCAIRNIRYTEYRRESFVVPINYLNYNIRDSINVDTPMEYRYKDWTIVKRKEGIKFELGTELFNSVREDYPLPFIEYQLSIN